LSSISISLGEICSLITDGKHGDCKNEDDSGFFFISAKDIKDGRIHYENARQIIYEDFLETHRRTNLQPGDILLTNSGTIGRLAIAPDEEITYKTTFQKSVAILKPILELINSKYLYYFLLKNQTRLENAARGAAQKNLLLSELRRFNILVPSKDVQNSIVSYLSPYDDLIENNRRRIQLLEEAARLLYQEWFVRLRFPGHEHTKIVDGVPEGWNYVSFPTIVDINPITKVDHGSKIRYIPMSALNEGLMIIKHEDIEVREKPTNVKFKNNDVLFARITPCLENGKTSFVYYLDNSEVACGSTEFIVFRGKMVSPFFVYCLSRTHDFRENAIKSMIGSSGRQRVQNSCFSEYSIMLAPQKILDLFDSTIKPIFKQIEILDRENQNLVKARDLLLPRLMNGVIPV